MAFTVPLLLGLLSLLSGCRKPALPVQGWVRLEALTVLHPDQATLADMDLRLQTLRRQREQLAGAQSMHMPPTTIADPTFALPALPSSAPSPALEHLTASLFTQELAASRRTLDRQQALERERMLEAARQASDTELISAYRALDATAASRRALVEKDLLTPLADAKDYRDRLAEQQAKNAERYHFTANLLATADAKYQQALQQYQQALAQVALDMQQAKQQADEDNQRALRDEIVRREKALQQQYAEYLAKEQERLAIQFVQNEATPSATTMTFPAIPAGTLALATPGLSEQITAVEARTQQDRLLAFHDIDKTIAALQQERQRVNREISNDTRMAVVSVAAQHGYRVSFTRGAGGEITASVRAWLGEYWSP